jgi:integrase/recombinase XerD
MQPTPSTPNFVCGSTKAKLVKRIARLVRAEALDAEGFRYVVARVRKLLGFKAQKKGRRLPAVLKQDEVRRFYAVVDRADNVLHSLLLRLLFYTGVRVSELCDLRVEDIDWAGRRIRVNEGKGGKDRVVLFKDSFAVALRAYLAGRTTGPLFVSRLRRAFTPRRIEQIVAQYAEAANVRATPHTFRHSCLTWLTQAGMADRELQLLSGHAKRDTLAIYQHLGLDDRLAAQYQKAMGEAAI